MDIFAEPIRSEKGGESPLIYQGSFWSVQLAVFLRRDSFLQWETAAARTSSASLCYLHKTLLVEFNASSSLFSASAGLSHL